MVCLPSVAPSGHTVAMDLSDPPTFEEKDRRVAAELLAELSRFVHSRADDADRELLPNEELRGFLRRHTKSDQRFFKKAELIGLYREFVETERVQPDPRLFRALRVKPRRTLSGVATVTVLTKPYPCPGKCTFCPTDARMPKSYLPDEPGCMRAERHQFDPFDQVDARIRTLHRNGHPVDKIELLILGGTWSSYANDYQETFIRRCLDAMNGTESKTVAEAQRRNEDAPHRNVGLVIETRPDHVRPREVRRLRDLGVTKVQMGAQSLDDEVLRLNQRGHDVAATRRAMDLLRAAGFKLVLHWMPNLLGSDPQKDRADFRGLWSDPSLRPDEIKIYPCSLLENAELYDFWKRGEYRPYEDDELIALVADCKTQVPEYCRINRVYRDIPSTHVVAGTRINNLRQCVQDELRASGRECRCLRCREVVKHEVVAEELVLRQLPYETGCGRELFLSFETSDDRVAGYLRLWLPGDAVPDLQIPELEGAALVREVHVYGQARSLGSEAAGAAQHAGLGRRLLEEAERIAGSAGFRRVAIIASVGTRGYYRKRGYRLDGTYMVKDGV